MKKIILCSIAFLALVSCNQDVTDHENVNVSFGVALPGTGSRNLATLTNPTVNYTIYKDTATYITATNVKLDSNNGSYFINVSLEKGATYSFNKFDVFEGTTPIYKLNPASDSFTVDTNGVVTPNPVKILLAYQKGDGYGSNGQGIFTINTDYAEGSAVNLTFKASIPAGVEVFVDTKTAYGWTERYVQVYDGDVYDMDTRAIYDPLVPGDNTVLTGGSLATDTIRDGFRFTIKKGTSEYTMTFTSTKYNKQLVSFDMGS